MFRKSGNSQTGYVTTDNYGYPHLGYPSNHFNITPFEALYADVHTYDHIVMYNTVQEFNDISVSDLERVRNFIVDEVESYNFYLQNFIVGQNHVLDANYEYEAWYKARGTLYIGNNVTPKTDAGDYIIEPTGNITTYAADAVHIKPGFHAQAGCQFHAFIQTDDYCSVSSISKLNGKKTEGINIPDISSLKVKSNQDPLFKVNKLLNNEILIDNEINIELYPNPNTGQFTLKINPININNSSNDINVGVLIIFNLAGKQVYQQQISSSKTKLDLNLEKGVYLVSYKNGQIIKQIKMIVQ